MYSAKNNIIRIASLVLAFSMFACVSSVFPENISPSFKINAVSSAKITSMTATQGPEITVGATGGTGFTYPVFNGSDAVKYEDVADDLRVFVKTDKNAEWTDIDNNAESGWIYDQNFGQFWEGGGGYWFHVEKTTYVRLQSRADENIYLDYTLIYDTPERNTFLLSADGATVLTAGKNGEVGLVLPKIDGSYPISSELDAFVYEVEADGKWLPLDDPKSGFSYRSSGYSSSSPSNQWGYWADGIYGLWFQPITEDCTIRVSYPADGVKGHDCKDNHIIYKIIGNPDAPRPSTEDTQPIELGKINSSEIDGWKLIWNDEFSGGNIDMSKWSHETGYYINDDPGTWGWGNNELEYYTDSPENSFVSNGKLTLRLTEDPKTFEQDKDRTAPYASGKLISKDKFSFKYGRIDFCAKLPVGTGIWPALWLLPNDSVYGTWAASGEIDVMEAKGRLDDTIYGTIHYGGTWPANTYTGSEYVFGDGKTYDDGFHVYSCIWEKEKIRWYVDGECYSVVPYTEWYSDTDKDNPYAPFDEEFYVIMNLAAGGNFDGGKAPDKSAIPSQMEVEYVRVYQADGDTSGSYTDKSENLSAPEKIDSAYILRLQNYLLGIKNDGSGLDYDGNGVINAVDIIKAKEFVLGFAEN